MGNKIKKWFKENKNEIAFVGYTSAILAGFGYTMFNLGRLDERMHWMDSLIEVMGHTRCNNMEVNSNGNDIQTDRDI